MLSECKCEVAETLYINKFVKIKEIKKIYTNGKYIVGDQVPAGEYYFWGKDIWYTKKGKSGRDYHEYKGDAYDNFKKGDQIHVDAGFFTSVNNIEYLWDESERLVPGHIYRLGMEIQSGSFFIKCNRSYTSTNSSNEEEDNCILDVYEDYTSGKCRRTYGKCEVVNVTNESGYIQIKNGHAIYLGVGEFDEFELVRNWLIEENRFFYQGIPVYRKTAFEIRLYKKYFNGGRFMGKCPIDIKNYYIYSVCGTLKWRAEIYPLTYQRPQTMTIQFGASNNRNNDFVVQIKEFGYRYDREMADRIYAITAILPNSLKGQDLKLKLLEYNGEKLIEPLQDAKNHNRVGFDNREIYSKEFEELKSLISRYEELDVEKELCYFEKYPHYISLVIKCLRNVFAKSHAFADKKGNENTIISFEVNINYSKYYYCASKIADEAYSIQKNNDRYIVSFRGTQIDEIEVMSYLFYDIKNKQDILTRDYLKENSYLYFTWYEIQATIDEFNKKHGYSSIITNSVLTRVIKILKKRLQKRVDEIYSNIAKEGKVQSKWGNEYHLFVLVCKFVKNVQYQYHCNWLGLQSFDIYLEDYKCAIEYQGQQHYEAIEYFGGQKGYERTKERDSRKRSMAQKNGVKILDWIYTEPVTEENVKRFLLENGITIDKEIDNNQFMHFMEQITPVIVKEKNIKIRQKSERVVKDYIVQYSLNGVMINKFSTLKAASDTTGVVTASIAKVIRGDRNSAGGFVWRKYAANVEIPKEIDILFDVNLINSGKSKRVARINNEGVVIETYDSLTEAAKVNNTKQDTIRSKIKKNVEWKYIE